MLLVLHELGPLEPLIDRAVVLRDGCVTQERAFPKLSTGEGDPNPEAAGTGSKPSTPFVQGVACHPGHDHVHPHSSAVEPPGLQDC